MGMADRSPPLLGACWKQSRVFWTEEGANAVMALRSVTAGGRLKSLWQAHHAALVA